MDGQTDGWMDGWIFVKAGRRTDGRMVGRMDYRRTGGFMAMESDRLL